MKLLWRVVPIGLFVFLAVAILYPNPFGNNPNIIADESYFLTSSLSAIQKMTLPGWEFSASGNYYGGVETYIDTAVLVPVIAGIVALHSFSLLDAQMWVALHTGNLLHILRLVNGALLLLTIGFFILFFIRRHIPRQLAQQLFFLLVLLLSNVLIIELFHTAKVWALFVLIDASVGALFIAQEYYLSHGNEPFISKERYVALFIWAGALQFFQTYVGVLSVFLWVLYALMLGHFSVSDIFNYLKKWWYLFVLLGLTQISFIYRALFVRVHESIFNFGDTSPSTDQGVDWFHRLYDPLVYALNTQPLVLLYIGGLIYLAARLWLNRSQALTTRRRLFYAIAFAHPLLVYFIYHVVLGFSLSERYALMLTIACSFSAVMLLGEVKKTLLLGTFLAGILFFIVNAHAILLYWKPSSETDLLKLIESRYNTPQNVFIEERSASGLTLPINAASLPLLDDQRKMMERFKFLIQHESLLQKEESFQPRTVVVYTDAEKVAAIKAMSTATSSVWTITRDCSRVCSALEVEANTCFQVHVDACGITSQEMNSLPVFLSANQLGSAYIARKVH